MGIWIHYVRQFCYKYVMNSFFALRVTVKLNTVIMSLILIRGISDKFRVLDNFKLVLKNENIFIFERVSF